MKKTIPKQAPAKKPAKPSSYGDVRRREIKALENDIFGFVLRPEKYSVLEKLDPRDEEVDSSFRADEPVLALSMDALKAFTRLAELARGGDKDAIGALANQASKIIHFLNELADGNGKGATAIKRLAAGSRFWPQLLGKHPDVLKESEKRMAKIDLGSKVSLKTGFSDLPTQDQQWRAIMGGYILRLSTAIRRVRSQRTLLERDVQKGVELSPWISEALELPEKESEWCSFALSLLKMMNGGSYPEDFIKRGRSNALFYRETVLLRKTAVKNQVEYIPIYSDATIGMKNRGVSAAEKAFRNSWKARF